jgi:hypothetical protein
VLGGGSTVPVRQVPGVHAQDDTAAKEGSCAATVVVSHTLHHRKG